MSAVQTVKHEAKELLPIVRVAISISVPVLFTCIGVVFTTGQENTKKNLVQDAEIKNIKEENLFMTFPVSGAWCLIEHDLLVTLVGKNTNWLKSKSWLEDVAYSSAKPSQLLLKALRNNLLRAT